MNIRTKILIVICLTFLALQGIVYFTAQWFLFQDAIGAEEKSTVREVTRLQASLDDQITEMDATVGDWAVWDDTYEFINSGDTDYIESNISNATLTNLGVELMLFINSSGQIVFGRMIDLESGAEIPIPKSLDSELQVGSRLLNHQDPTDKIAGIISLPEGTMIIVSQPIVTSQGEGPSRGTLIMGRFLDEAEIAKLSQRTQLSISAFPYNGAVLPEDVALARNLLVGVKPNFVAPQSETVISGYALVNDVYGNPALILRVDTPRDAFAQSKKNMRYLGLSLLAIDIVSVLMTMLLLDRLVITRLTNLNSSVMKIGSQVTAASRVKATGNDEIFVLATSINSMLASLENSRAKERESEERYKKLASISPVGIFRTDPKGVTIYVNPMWCHISGLSVDEALGNGWLGTVHPEDKENLTKSWQETTLLHQASFADYRFVRPDGTVAWVMGQTIPEMNSENQIVGYLGTVTDITARKQIEAEQEQLGQRLRDQQFYTRSLFEANLDALMTTDQFGIITDVNKQMEALTGYTRDELIGAPFNRNFTDPEQAEASIKLVLSEKKVSNYELTVRARDGRKTVVSYSATTFYDRDRKLQGVFAAARDVTERNRMEYELRKLSRAIEQSPATVVITDREGKVEYVNPKFTQTTGYTAKEALEQNPRVLKSGVHPKEFYKDLWDTILAGREWHGEFCNHKKNGELYWESASISPIRNEAGEITHFVAVKEDITIRKRLDEELKRAKEAAEQANLAKSEFLSSMSHELRSPLNAILGFAQLLETDSPPPTPGQQESIAQILRAGWHLLKLINEVLDLAKVESGQVPLSPEAVSLAEVILECQDMIEMQAQERGIQLIFPSFETPYFVLADRTRVKQVLLNLLSNAIKYNSQQGTVEVKCSEGTQGRIRVSIRDTGPGLSPPQMAQLFQSFNRLGQEAGGVEGTGIGLVVARRLAELMGGVIEVESTVGVGSVFWFELLSVAEPHLSIEVEDAAALAQAQITHKTRLQTLLYVEDNPANLKLVEQIIARQPDMRLLTAINGKSGLEIARSSQPDVILMDINLPDINGFEALKTLRSNPATAHIPVVALSANAMPRDIEKGLEAGFLRYLTKPIKLNEFMDALAEALDFAEAEESK